MTPAEIDAELGGYAEVRFADQLGVDGVPWMLAERLRPRFEIAPSDRATAEVVVEASLAQGRDLSHELGTLVMESPVGEVLDDAGCGYERAPRYDEAADVFSVERLHVDWNLPGADVSVGRQALRWGSGLVFHPTDLYAEILVTEPWREPRGVNAVKVDVPVGESNVVGVLAVDDDLSGLYDGAMDSAADLPVSGAVKATLRALDTDWSIIGQGGTDGDWFAGADLRGTLGVGWWVEGGWHGDSGAPEVVVGIDYSFPVFSRFYLAAEYRYDGSGARPEDYDFSQRATGAVVPFDCEFLATPAATRDTLGIHYADAALSVLFTEDLGLTTAVVVNLLDGTGMLVPDAQVLVGDRVTVHAGAQVPFGKDGEYRPADEDLTYVVGQDSVDLAPLFPDATLLGWVRYAF